MPLNLPMEAIRAEATTEASCFPPVILGVGVSGVWGCQREHRERAALLPLHAIMTEGKGAKPAG